MNSKLQGIIHGIIPAFFLAISVGQIYAFTNFSSDIANYIGRSQNEVQVAFSLGIFFLGMGAAFFGKIVEKNIKLSTMIGTTLFLLGMVVTSLGIKFNSLIGIYLGYGFLIGLGTGIIYISPVKTMMMWYQKYKALASAVPIIFFGLGSTLSTILYTKYINFGIENIFYYFGITYLVMMIIGILLLKKPIKENSIEGTFTEHTETTSDGRSLTKLEYHQFSYKDLLTDRFFIHSWLFMFLNISSGLCLIPLAKQMMKTSEVGYSVGLITIIVGLCGLMNGGGRFAFAFASDKMKERINIIGYILIISFVTMICSIYQPVIGMALLIINACYGAGFSVIPAILSDHFGMTNISKIHGAVLSAWGVAGLVGNQLAIIVSDKCEYGNIGVIYMLIVLYGINFINFLFMKKSK